MEFSNLHLWNAPMMMMIQLKITIILYKNCLTMDNGNAPNWELLE